MAPTAIAARCEPTDKPKVGAIAVPPLRAVTVTTSCEALETLGGLHRSTRHGFEWFNASVNFLAAVFAYCRSFSCADNQVNHGDSGRLEKTVSTSHPMPPQLRKPGASWPVRATYSV